MRLRNLLRWISSKRPVEAVVCAALLLCACHVTALADGEAQASVTVGGSYYTDAYFLVDVTVSFEDMELYNDSIRLSYHAVSAEGQDIAFENQRIPVVLGEGNSMTCTVAVDMAGFPEGTDAYLKFDLVDEENGFWFSYNPEVSFVGGEVLCNKANLVRGTVSIEIVAESYTETQYCVDVLVSADNPALLSGEKYLSYHVYDAEGGEIAFENLRCLIVPDENGTFYCPLRLDAAYLPLDADTIIRFDVVDQINAFWYSNRQFLTLQSAEAIYNSANLIDPAAEEAARKRDMLVKLSISTAVVVAAEASIVLILIRKRKKK